MPPGSLSGPSGAPPDPARATAALGDGERRRVSLLVFRVGPASYAIAADDVIEVVRMVAATPAPDAPAWSSGLINVRGRVVPLIDARTRLGLARMEPDISTPIVLLQLGEQAAGLVVDQVVDVINVPQDELMRPDLAPNTTSTGLLTEVADLNGRLILVLDKDQLCEASELSAVAAAWQARP
ncbi:MAG: chemotaxis protein CheW [Actinomycetota bacterium]|nr:chemotaxis protein CheW [Actinomycetota bacterium]